MSKKQLKTVIEMQDKFSKELKDFSQQLHNATDDLKNLILKVIIVLAEQIN